MPRPPPQGGPPQVMHNDPRGPRPDWNRPPGKVFYFELNWRFPRSKLNIWISSNTEYYSIVNRKEKFSEVEGFSFNFVFFLFFFFNLGFKLFLQDILYFIR